MLCIYVSVNSRYVDCVDVLCRCEDMRCPVQVLDQYKSVGAELNVMPYCSQFIPLEVVNHPQHK